MSAIRSSIISVPDQILSPRCLDTYPAGIRRALPAIEEGLTDRVAWHLYADFTAIKVLATARFVYGPKLRRKPR